MTERAKRRLASAFVSQRLWQRLNRPIYHPVAKHFLRQLKGNRSVPSAIAIALLAALLLPLALARIYSSIGSSVIWSLPLCLMFHSLLCSASWMYRIVSLISRQGRDGVLDEVSVIPPGPVFIYLAICKVVLHEQDALAWITMLRKIAAAAVFFALALSIFVALSNLEHIDASRLWLLLTELSLLSFVIIQEHKQSVLLSSLLPMALSRQLKGPIDGTSLVMACYAALQILSFAIALAGPAALQAIAWSYRLPIDFMPIGLALMLALFLLSREALIWGLWRIALRQTNGEGSVLRQTRHTGEPIGAETSDSRAIDAPWQPRRQPGAPFRHKRPANPLDSAR